MKKTIVLDFDGVLHAYTSPWSGPARISDGPVAGAVAWCWAARERFELVVVSSRCETQAGIEAICDWLQEHDFPPDIAVQAHKPPAFVTIDDRAVTFDGTWPELDVLAKFTPWNRP